MNKEYTYSWINGFDEQKLNAYHVKFYKNFEKNIKHIQQIQFIKKYLRQDMYWLDAPIGSGRLMNELQCRHMIGFDKSHHFVEYNKAKGIETIQGDLFYLPFHNKFDLITSLHTIFAFDDFRDILKNLVSALKNDGILIVDILNQNHIDASNPVCGSYPYKSSMTKAKISEFFQGLNCEVLEIIPHDFYDNRFILFWRENCGKSTKLLRKIFYKTVNFLYFALKLKFIFDKISCGWDEKYYTKYLVAVRKKNSSSDGSF